MIPCSCCGATSETDWIDHPLAEGAVPLCALCQGADLLAVIDRLPPSHHLAARAAARVVNALVDAQGKNIREAFNAALMGIEPPTGTYDSM